VINKIAVDGEFLNLQPSEVEVLVSNAVTGGFFSLDVDRLQQRILNNPWIATVSVRRIWPDSIRVSIKEQDPVAYWGKHTLLNVDADIFAPEALPTNYQLVRLDGPIGTEAAVLENYWLLKSVFDGMGIKLDSVEMNERRSWKLQTNDGVVIRLGREELLSKIKRFQTAHIASLNADWPQISEVDLRYTNGLTVKKVPQLISDSNTQR
jgi:cell division protein FtsQ